MSRLFESLEKRTFLTATLGAKGLLLVEGTSDADQITLSRSGARIVVEQNGSDDVRFRAADVTRIRVLGHDGNDEILIDSNLGIGATVLGEGDFDTLTSKSGNDTIKGGNGDDDISAGAGNDSLTGGEGDDTIAGGGGNDTLKGNLDADVLSGGSGDDLLFAGEGFNFLNGGSGSDVVNGGEGIDNIYAFDGDQDTIRGGPGPDIAEIDQLVDRTSTIENFIRRPDGFITSFVQVGIRIDVNDVDNTYEVLSSIGPSAGSGLLRIGEGALNVTLSGPFPDGVSQDDVIPMLTITDTNAGTGAAFFLPEFEIDSSNITIRVATFNILGVAADRDFTLIMFVPFSLF